MKLIEATIQGTFSLLQNRFSENSEGDLAKDTRAVKLHKLPPREQAEIACYRAPNGTIYHPGAAIARLLREAGSGHKQRGSRKNVKYIIPSSVLVPEDTISLLDATGKPHKTFEVDSRPVVIPSTRGRIMRHRPRYDSWRMTFMLEVNEGLIDVAMVQQLLTEGGVQLGLGDFRPEKGGPFGRFAVIRWEEESPAADKKKAA